MHHRAMSSHLRREQNTHTTYQAVSARMHSDSVRLDSVLQNACTEYVRIYVTACAKTSMTVSKVVPGASSTAPSSENLRSSWMRLIHTCSARTSGTWSGGVFAMSCMKPRRHERAHSAYPAHGHGREYVCEGVCMQGALGLPCTRSQSWLWVCMWRSMYACMSRMLSSFVLFASV